MASQLINENPTIYDSGFDYSSARSAEAEAAALIEDRRDPIDSFEVFDIIRDIKDPEHPNTLEQLRVVQPSLIHVDDERSLIKLQFTPTVPHCSMCPLIGLSLRVKLQRCLPRRFKISVHVAPGTHDLEDSVNKQLNDKERVAAALENKNLRSVIVSCIRGVPG